MSFSFEEAADLIEGLTVELDSHLCMSLLKWKYPAGRQEIYAAGTFARVVNATRGKGEKAPEIDLPWDVAAPVEHVTPDERAKLVASLRSRSAFGQKRTEVTDG